MPWELIVVQVAGQAPQKSPATRDTIALGPLEEVQRQLQSVLPGIQFYKEPSGLEKLEAMKERGIELPESLKSLFANLEGSYRGVYEGEGFTFEFCFVYRTQVTYAFLDVRGNGDPLHLLHRITETTNWAVYDIASSNLIQRSGWEEFTNWRDRAIESIKEDKKT